MVVALDVSKLLTSTDSKDLQFRNMPFISVALDVSKLLRLTDLSAVQSRNNSLILLTCDVLRLLRSTVSRDEHPLNMPPM